MHANKGFDLFLLHLDPKPPTFSFPFSFPNPTLAPKTFFIVKIHSLREFSGGICRESGEKHDDGQQLQSTVDWSPAKASFRFKSKFFGFSRSNETQPVFQSRSLRPQTLLFQPNLICSRSRGRQPRNSQNLRKEVTASQKYQQLQQIGAIMTE